MEKTKIKNFAVAARDSLIGSIKRAMFNYGMTEEGIQEKLPSSTREIEYYVNDERFALIGSKIKWRQKLVQELTDRQQKEDYLDAYNDLVEEVAYTWFNRIIAIRFMEVNNYLPSRVRVLSSEEGSVEPDIMKYALDLEDDLGKFTPEELAIIQRKRDTESQVDSDAMYEMLFIKQADALGEILPHLFEKTTDYMKLLFTARYNAGVIKDLITTIPESYFDVFAEGQVEIIGWLYQYYNTAPHDRVVNISGGAVKKKDIPAATQLFTTDWVVRYMVDNSIGKYYLERHQDSELTSELEYLLPDEIQHVDDHKEITEYKLIDNAMGSGHILVYAFDIFMKMYEEEGYTKRDAAQKILENNLYGLEIDKRAFQLAYFALMMKGRQYDRRLFSRQIKLNVHQFRDLVVHDEFYSQLNPQVANELKDTLQDFSNAQEFGSIITLDSKVDLDKLTTEVEGLSNQDGLDVFNVEEDKATVLETLKTIKVMRQKYEAVVTNPPYMNKFEKTLKDYLKKHYKDYSKDLFSVFIYNNMQMLTAGGYAGYMTPLVWMFIKSYESLRTRIINTRKIDSLIQMEYSAFEEATVPINTFVIKNTQDDKVGTYLRLSDFKGGMEVQKQKVLEAISNPDISYLYRTNQANFEKIPGKPISYWANKVTLDIFNDSKSIKELGNVKSGIMVRKDFIRYWFEVNTHKFAKNISNVDEMKFYKWFSLNSGGGYRKWYGLNELVINLGNEANEIINSGTNYRLRSRDYYFKPGITWGRITSSNTSFRMSKISSLFGDAGPMFFSDNETNILIIAILNSKVLSELESILNPTLNFQVSDLANIPVKRPVLSNIKELVLENVSVSKRDDNLFEESWEFIYHPLIQNIAEHEKEKLVPLPFLTSKPP